MHRAFDLVDEVWVASEFTREAVAAETSKPVHVVPVPLEPPEVSPVSRAEVGLPDGFLFLFSFDFLSIAERKYPLGLVEAFCRAFRPGEGPMLAIKSINGDRRSEELTRLRRAAAGRPDVHVLDGYVPPATKDAVMASCDCYVSLHRSEGLGLTLAEAMALGKPVIATGYSGNLAFMDEENSYLVRHGTAITPAGIDPYPAGAEWAEPDLDHAAELMRRVYEHPEEARERGARARRDLLASHSVAQAAAFIRRRLDEIPMHGNLLRDVRGPLERAAALVSQQAGDSLVRAPRRWSPAGLVRPLLRRALWPELAEQKQLDAALVEALRGLERVSPLCRSRP